MKLDRVTITGADDSISPQALLDLHKEFRFVEFGILLAKSRVGTPRYPSYRWLLDLYELSDRTVNIPDLSCHICGQWSRDLLAGKWSLPWRYDWVPALFSRAQINFTASPDEDFGYLETILNDWQSSGSGISEFIIQHNEANEGFFEVLREMASFGNFVPLFDRSGGKGELPGAWPNAEYVEDPDGSGVDRPIYHGYAGGLGPENLEVELPKIAEAAGAARIWIDMESKVRSDDDKTFDLAKVRRCLEICAPFITSN
jgi:hypothetical protein